MRLHACYMLLLLVSTLCYGWDSAGGV